VIRSGEVIPKLEKVVSPSHVPEMPETCPSCGGVLEWKNDFLRCTSPACPAKIEQRISHWFKTLGTADWFGIKTIERLVANGYDSLEKIYAMQESDFTSLGFGPVQSKNLADALRTSRTRSVEDWRFLAAFGISNLGKGDSRKLLAHYPLDRLVEISAEDVKQIHGFGDVTSRAIQQDIGEMADTIRHMLGLGFNLQRTPIRGGGRIVESPIAGKRIVFTGKMARGTRDELQALARKYGADVHTSVSSKTDYLVCGEDVGAAKLKKAETAGTTIISEAAFFGMIGETGA
jgi:DNA ligase (NAD+)